MVEETLRIRLDIAYDGTDFHGWARQTQGTRTVQATIEDALSLVLRAPISLTVAGRTDAGVPVSYTHLRAHETEADLVCRLLLEKKKK